MADESKLRLLIESIFNPRGTDDAAAGVNKVGTAAKTAKDGVDELKSALQALVAAAAVIAFFEQATEGALEMEKAMRLVDQTATKMGLGVEETRKKVKEFASELSALAGVEDDQIVKAVGRAFAATGDLEQAMARAAMAADLAAKYDIDFAAAANVVAEAARGKMKALDKLTGVTTEGKDATEKAANAMKFLETNVRGASSSVNDHAMQAARLKAQWKDFNDTVGEKLISILDWLRDGFFNVGNGIGMVIAKTMNWISGTIEGFGNLGIALKRMLSGDIKGGMNDLIISMSETSNKIKDLNVAAENDAETRDRNYYAAKKKRISDLVTETLRANKTMDAEDENAHVEKRRRLTQEEADQVEASKFRQKLLAQKTIEEEKFKKLEKKLKDDAAKDDKARMKQMDSERDAELSRAIDRTVAEVKAKKRAAEIEKQMALDVANASIALAGQLFGDSKELAIASAIINTYEGATKALAQGGVFGPILAAIVIASGLAQVATISSTEPSTKGGGFDDPSNDAAARLGGRRWARDMIGEFTQGVNQGWAQGMAGAGTRGMVTNNTSNNTTNVNVSVAGYLDPNDQRGLKQLARRLAVVNKTVEGQRRTARTGS